MNLCYYIADTFIHYFDEMNFARWKISRNIKARFYNVMYGYLKIKDY